MNTNNLETNSTFVQSNLDGIRERLFTKYSKSDIERISDLIHYFSIKYGIEISSMNFHYIKSRLLEKIQNTKQDKTFLSKYDVYSYQIVLSKQNFYNEDDIYYDFETKNHINKLRNEKIQKILNFKIKKITKFQDLKQIEKNKNRIKNADRRKRNFGKFC